MKRIVIILLALTPFIAFSQGAVKTEIDWIPLAKAEKFAEMYNKNILLFIFRDGCDYCAKMKKETLSDPQVIKTITENFLPVMINGKDKNPIIFNGKEYVNDHPAPEDAPWRHNLFVELVEPVRGNYYWPNVVILNSKLDKVTQFPGFQPKTQILRNLNRFIK